VLVLSLQNALKWSTVWNKCTQLCYKFQNVVSFRGFAPWHSTSLWTLLGALSPDQRIGLQPTFKRPLPTLHFFLKSNLSYSLCVSPFLGTNCLSLIVLMCHLIYYYTNFCRTDPRVKTYQLPDKARARHFWGKTKIFRLGHYTKKLMELWWDWGDTFTQGDESFSRLPSDETAYRWFWIDRRLGCNFFSGGWHLSYKWMATNSLGS